MLLMMLEKGVQVDRVICIDTTKEFPAMYRHIQAVQAIIPVEIEIVKIDFDYWFSGHVRTKGKHAGVGGGYGWPYFRNRWCTALKREAFREKTYGSNKKKDIANSDIVEFHGIAADESKRNHDRGHYKNVSIKRPLIDWNITEKQALEYCYSKGLTWEGLYEKFSRVSCWCCPLSRIGELRVLHNEFPELWAELERMDKKSFRDIKESLPVSRLAERFKAENKPKEKQMELF